MTSIGQYERDYDAAQSAGELIDALGAKLEELTTLLVRRAAEVDALKSELRIARDQLACAAETESAALGFAREATAGTRPAPEAVRWILTVLEGGAPF